MRGYVSTACRDRTSVLRVTSERGGVGRAVDRVVPMEHRC